MGHKAQATALLPQFLNALWGVQLVQKKTALQFKAMDQTLQTHDKDGNKQALSYRCARHRSHHPQPHGRLQGAFPPAVRFLCAGFMECTSLCGAAHLVHLMDVSRIMSQCRSWALQHANAFMSPVYVDSRLDMLPAL